MLEQLLIVVVLFIFFVTILVISTITTTSSTEKKAEIQHTHTDVDDNMYYEKENLTVNLSGDVNIDVDLLAGAPILLNMHFETELPKRMMKKLQLKTDHSDIAIKSEMKKTQYAKHVLQSTLLLFPPITCENENDVLTSPANNGDILWKKQ